MSGEVFPESELSEEGTGELKAEVNTAAPAFRQPSAIPRLKYAPPTQGSLAADASLSALSSKRATCDIALALSSRGLSPALPSRQGCVGRRRGWRQSGPRPSAQRRAAIRSAPRARPGASCPKAMPSRPLPAPTMPRYRQAAASQSGMPFPSRRASAPGGQGVGRRHAAPLPRPWPEARRLRLSPRWLRSARP